MSFDPPSLTLQRAQVSFLRFKIALTLLIPRYIVRCVCHTHLVHHNTQTPYIDLRSDDSLICEHFWSYVAIRATSFLHHSTFRARVHYMRETKITKFDLREFLVSVLMEEDIGEFHITVNNSF